MHAGPKLGAAVLCAVACFAAIPEVACVLSFPTLQDEIDGGTTIPSDANHDAAVLGPRFCADAGSVYCEDFDGVAFGQDGGPNTKTGLGVLDAVTDVFFSPPRSLLPTLSPSSADQSAYLGFTVPMGINTDFELDAEIKVDAPSVFTTTPRNVIVLQVPQADTIAVAFSSESILVIAGGVTYDAQVSVPAASWFFVELAVRLEDHTFTLTVESGTPLVNLRGIGLYPGDAGAPDGGAKPASINAYFGADLPASEINTNIHIDNVVVKTQ